MRVEFLVDGEPVGELSRPPFELSIDVGWENLERVGDRQRYRELLAPIAAGNGTGWVSAIACQELARSLLEAGSPGGAESLLESALERMPDRQALWILLAHVHDRQGLLSRSWESLERVAASPTADDRSERLTYDDWANGPLERARRVLQRDAAALRAALSAELGSTVAVQP